MKIKEMRLFGVDVVAVEHKCEGQMASSCTKGHVGSSANGDTCIKETLAPLACTHTHTHTHRHVHPLHKANSHSGFKEPTFTTATAVSSVVPLRSASPLPTPPPLPARLFSFPNFV